MGENRDVSEISASKRQWGKNGSGVKILGRHTEKSEHGPAEIRSSYLDVNRWTRGDRRLTPHMHLYKAREPGLLHLYSWLLAPLFGPLGVRETYLSTLGP